MTEPTTWSLLDLPGTLPAASYLTSSNSKQYRLIVDLLAQQRDITLTGVGFDELAALVRARLPQSEAATLVDELALESRMRQLVEWGTCTSWQDRAETAEDFIRNRYRYQLTEAGSALNQAVHTLEAELGSDSTAALLAPSIIVERLRAMFDALAQDDPGQASGEFAQVETTLTAMREAAGSWQTRLAAAMGGAPTEDKINRLLETILAYAEAWGSGIDAWTEDIASFVPRLEALSPEQWRAMALARVRSRASEQLLLDTIRGMETAVQTLGIWFAGPRPQAAHLRRQIRDAVVPVLRGHRALLAVGGTVSRKADLLRLAGALETADSDEEAWQLWCTATGLYSARHVEDHAPEVSHPTHTSVWDAPPVPISRRLRTQGVRSVGGRAMGIADRRAARQRARQQALLDQRQLDRAAQSLSERSGTKLSTWTKLSTQEAEILLDLLAESRQYRGGNAPQSATTPDGRWRLTFTPGDGSAVLEMPQGRLVLDDGLVEFGP